jgi:hypothetical protein
MCNLCATHTHLQKSNFFFFFFEQCALKRNTFRFFQSSVLLCKRSEFPDFVCKFSIWTRDRNIAELKTACDLFIPPSHLLLGFQAVCVTIRLCGVFLLSLLWRLRRILLQLYEVCNRRELHWCLFVFVLKIESYCTSHATPVATIRPNGETEDLITVTIS